MKNWKLILGVLAVFLLGMITGAAVAKIIAKRAIEHTLEGGPPWVNEAITRRLTRELRLDTDQREAISQIIARSQGRLQEIRREVQPEIVQELETTAAAIRQELNERQRKKFDERLAKGRARLQRLGPPPLPPPPPDGELDNAPQP